ncbi:MAG: N-acetylmuramoyl-L-alanine amidase [Candidatus Bipolaricaulota bacterium]
MPGCIGYAAAMTKLGVLAVALFAAMVALLVASSVTWPPPSPPIRPRATVVVVDAGHGGHDPGAVVAGIEEKDVDLALALQVFELAEADPRLEVVLTRTGDYYVDLRERVRLAEKEGAALYLSIHANANASPNLCGVETWVHEDVRPGDRSWQLAEDMQAAVVAATGGADRGVLRQPLYLRHTYLPAALVEVGYLTCPQERVLLLDRSYRERIAEGIFEGILEFLR